LINEKIRGNIVGFGIGYSEDAIVYRTVPGAGKSLARPGRKQARKHVRDRRDLNKIGTRSVIKFLFLQGKAPKEIHATLTETLACFIPGRAKDLSYQHSSTVEGRRTAMTSQDWVPPCTGP